MAVTFVSCETNKPEQDASLIGMWSSKTASVIELSFNSDHTLYYMQRPDTTEIPIPDVIISAELTYETKKNILYISGDNGWGGAFSFSTGYHIEDAVLTLDSFSYNAKPDGFYKPLVLYKE